MKIQDHDFTGLPQQVQDFKDDVSFLLNYGKMQFPMVTSPPTWTGRAGETVLVVAGGTSRLYICTTDSSASWGSYIAFTVG